MNLIDKRGNLPTWNKLKKGRKKRNYSKRDIKKIDSIAVHHSATFEGSSEAFANYHINHNGWPGIGYTYVIYKDGQIDWCYDWNIKTAHVGNSNRTSLGICLIGNFTKEEPTEQQLQSASNLCMILIDKIESIKEIKSHQSFPGYSWKNCPSFDVMKITNRMRAFKDDHLKK